MKNLVVLDIGVSGIAAAIFICKYIKKATEGADLELVQTCNEYCDGNSESTFPKACTLACK